MLLPERGKSKNEERRQNRKRLDLEQVREKIGELKETNQLQLADVFDDQQIHDICHELKFEFEMERAIVTKHYVFSGRKSQEKYINDFDCRYCKTRFWTSETSHYQGRGAKNR